MFKYFHCSSSMILLKYLFLIIFLLILCYPFFYDYESSTIASSFPIDFLVEKSNKLCQRSKSLRGSSVYPLDNILSNLTFSKDTVYHHNGIAYDYYSIIDLEQIEASCQWKIWPLSNEINQQTSPSIVSKLPFIDAIYVMSDPRLKERHINLKKAFDHQGISFELINWRMKWNLTTCNSNLTHSYVYQRLNLKDKPLNKNQERRCALTMKHVDVWYEMAEKKVGLGLILEDDAIFVPFFKEKLTRMISSAINDGILRINRTCIKSQENLISDDERINQNPMIVIGTCFNFHDKNFQSDLLNPLPILSTHKCNPSRCTHAYLLTSCSAQSLIDQIQIEKNDFYPSDFLQNNLFVLSSTLQSFWLDPPLSYQGNQVIDLDKMVSFKSQTYMSDN